MTGIVHWNFFLLKKEKKKHLIKSNHTNKCVNVLNLIVEIIKLCDKSSFEWVRFWVTFCEWSLWMMTMVNDCQFSHVAIPNKDTFLVVKFLHIYLVIIITEDQEVRLIRLFFKHTVCFYTSKKILSVRKREIASFF